jgi:HK97 family phage major capsid protein
MTRKEQYQALCREQRDFLDNTVKERKAADPAFDFTKDEAYQKRDAQIGEMLVLIQEEKKLEERERAFDNAAQTRSDARNTGSTNDDEVQVRALDTYLRTKQPGDLKLRTSLIGTGTTTGGYLVPTLISNAIIQDLNAVETVRRLGAQVMTVEGNTNVVVMQDATALFVAEGSSLTATDPTVAQVTIRPTLLQANTSYTWQLANRSVADIQSQLRGSFARGIAKAESAAFLYGGGSSAPAGLIAGISATSATASTSTFTATELLSCYWGLNPQFANTATWIMSPAAAAIARSLESTNGAQLWQPNLRDGNAELMGRPVVIDANMDAVAGGGKKPVAFVSVPDAYVIGEEGTMSALVDPYSAAGTGYTKFYMYRFVDGRVKNSAAGKALAIKVS